MPIEISYWNKLASIRSRPPKDFAFRGQLFWWLFSKWPSAPSAALQTLLSFKPFLAERHKIEILSKHKKSFTWFVASLFRRYHVEKSLKKSHENPDFAKNEMLKKICCGKLLAKIEVCLFCSVCVMMQKSRYYIRCAHWYENFR